MNTKSLIHCANVYVKHTGTSKGLGAFASRPIKKGSLVEMGIMRRVDTNGHMNPYLFTWSEDRTVWAYASGCATFYNTSLNPNVKMNRVYEKDTFTMIALRDINKHDELLHTYQSLQWRECFQPLNKEFEQSMEP
jgi:hypothetical protein